MDQYDSKPDLPGVRRAKKYSFMDMYNRLYCCHAYELAIDGVWIDDRIYWTL
jgi:hypothetical protein